LVLAPLLPLLLIYPLRMILHMLVVFLIGWFVLLLKWRCCW
jgi:hypothetical protein